MLHVVDGPDEHANVKAGLGTKRMPYDRWRVEHERLQEQNERHPLIVGYVRFLEVVGSGHFFFPWKIVRVRYPAYVVGVFDVRAGELSRHPTRYG